MNQPSRPEILRYPFLSHLPRSMTLGDRCVSHLLHSRIREDPSENQLHLWYLSHQREIQVHLYASHSLHNMIREDRFLNHSLHSRNPPSLLEILRYLFSSHLPRSSFLRGLCASHLLQLLILEDQYVSHSLHSMNPLNLREI